MSKRYSKDELNYIKDLQNSGKTYKDIAYLVNLLYTTNRNENGIAIKCHTLGWKSCVNNTKTHEDFILNINQNIQILEKYSGAQNNIKTKCLKCNYVWKPRASHLTQGHGCPKCAGNTKKKHKEFLSEMYILNPTLKISEEYKGAHNNIKVKCLVCYYVWKPTPHNLLYGKGCPKCVNKNRLGHYSTLTKEHADSLDFPLYLYHVKLQYEDEIFYKYGLTSRLNKQRFKEYKPYKVVEEISFKEYDAWTAICKEKALKSNYTPKYKFGGWTECYNN